MKKTVSIFLFLAVSACVNAQNETADSLNTPKVTINKDPRLDILAKIEADVNSMSTRFAKGYRLFVLKTNDRDYAMKVRAYLLQNFPEEKVIMTYQSPFIKMKFGDFVEKEEAERYRDLILKDKLLTGNIYIVPETVEVKPDKIKEEL